ncbi:MAG: hypothetical protein ABSF61_12290 [Anaerolineales bacterium]|jgi:transketolase
MPASWSGWRRVNFAAKPEEEFDGFYGACSTYGSFSYLKYGMLRLFGQLAQDCQFEVGKVVLAPAIPDPKRPMTGRTSACSSRP